MNRIRSTLVALAGLATLAAPAAAGPYSPLLAQQINPVFPFEGPLQINPQPRGCPDPAAFALRIDNVRVRTFAGVRVYDFQLVGVVRNVGGQTYSSGINQQTATIKQMPAGGGLVRTLSTSNFPTLAPNAEIVIPTGMITGWSKSDEFPASFELAISYDPDIFIDGNPANDDCTLGNNRRVLTGADINALLPN